MKIQTAGLFVLIPLLLTLIQGCASPSSAQRDLDSKLAREPGIDSRTELRSEADRSIQSMEGLTAEQRTRLARLREETRARLDQLRAQSYRLRSLLIRDMTATRYDEDEVELIKTRVKDVEDHRLSVILNAVDQANTILARNAPEHRDLLEEYFEPRGMRN